MTASNVCPPRKCPVCYYIDQLSCDRPKCPTRQSPEHVPDAGKVAGPTEGAEVRRATVEEESAIEAALRFDDSEYQMAFREGYIRAAVIAGRRLQSALTAERGKLAAWMIHHDFVTGHGDTMDDLLAELGAQVDERREAFNDRVRVIELQIKDKAALQQQLTAAQAEIADLRNRLNWSEKLQGRFPVDAVQPDQKAAGASRRWNIDRDGDDLLICFNDHDKGDKCEYVRYTPKEPR